MSLFSAILEFLFMGSSAHDVFESLVTAVIRTARRVMRDIYERVAQAAEAVWGFVNEHPMFCAAVALGILAIVAPWFLQVLGFGTLGPTAGTFAAWWQSTYAGFVAAGSLFSFFQYLGMAFV